MSGAFRFFLAWMVVLCHLVDTLYFHHLGYYAVRAFFVLSGFAITAALNEVYRFDAKRFWISRFFRLVPLYLVVCFLTGLTISFYPVEAAQFMSHWASPATPAIVAENLLILPLAFGHLDFRFIAPAWSLAVEIIMYAVLWIGVGRSARGALMCFANGAAYHCYKLLTGAPFVDRYATLESALLGFAIGALIFFWRKQNTLHTRKDFALFVSIAWLVNFFAEGTLMPEGYAEQTGFYVNTALAAVVVLSLSALRPGPRARRIDAVLGHLSYPVFLVHWLGGLAGYVLLSSKFPRGWELVLASTPIILNLAAALALLYAHFVEPLRSGYRKFDKKSALCFEGIESR